MAAQTAIPSSLQAAHRTSTPFTPIHSPHQSLSSTASRTPVHALSLHEYRKQQNTPSLKSISSGKSLRRKPAASGLNTLERVPSTSSNASVRPPSSSFHSPQLSRSEPTQQQINFPLLFPPSPPDNPPPQKPRRRSFGSSSSYQRRESASTQLEYPSTDEAENFYRSYELATKRKVGRFKPIKRLPKPVTSYQLVTSQAHPPAPSSLVLSSEKPAVTSTLRRPSPLQSTSSADNQPSSGGLTTASTLSLSRFPQPPHLIHLSTSSEKEDDASPRVNFSFTATAPETPPATPAVLHYRGTSFDVVNPHASLLLHDIETPGDRDADSYEEYFDVRSSDEYLMSQDKDMARSRAIYNDLNTAHRSIRGGHGEPQPKFELPVHPVPAVVNSNGSKSPHASIRGDSQHVVTPSKFQKGPESPSFIQRLTKTFTRKGGKTKAQEPNVGEELRNLPVSDQPRPSATYSRPLSQFNQSSPIVSSSNDHFRGEEQRPSFSEADVTHDGYYDDASIYPPSSIYTTDVRRSVVPPSLYSRRQSYLYDMGEAGDDYATEYQSAISPRSTKYEFGPPSSTSQRVSRPVLSAEFLCHPDMAGKEKTDTLSKLIDNYGADETQTSLDFGVYEDEDTVRMPSPLRPRPFPSRAQQAQVSSGISQFDFGLEPVHSHHDSEVSSLESPRSSRDIRKPTFHRGIAGAAPLAPLPLAPAFQYEPSQSQYTRQGMSSEMFSHNSSYGDTRNLLQLPQPLPAPSSEPTIRKGKARKVTDSLVMSNAGTPQQLKSTVKSQNALQIDIKRALEPSSSYSQDDGHTTPQEALDEAERIFTQASTDQKQNTDGIPLIWMGRSSMHLIPRQTEPARRESPGQDSLADLSDSDSESDWETIGEHSHQQLGRPSLDDSIADYSSNASFGVPNDLPVPPADETMERAIELPVTAEGDPALLTPYNVRNSGSYAVYNAQTPLHLSSTPYRQPNPLRMHEHPFHSSPPALGLGSAHGASQSPLPVETPAQIQDSNGNSANEFPVLPERMSYRGHPDHYRPIPNPYQPFSDKVTQELLTSGPNDDIFYETEGPERPSSENQIAGNLMRAEPPTTGTLGQRENSFAKMTMLGPKGNLTGTPRGTGMHEVGSSIADLSTPCAAWSSSPVPPLSPENIYTSSLAHKRGSSQCTQWPTADTAFENATVERGTPSRTPQSLQANKPVHEVDENAITPIRPNGRAAVRKQTKLKHMVLSPETGSTTTIQTQFPQMMSDRSSSVNTTSPLRLQRGIPVRPLPSQDSPHLLRPDRPSEPVLLKRQAKTSWIVFAMCAWCPLLLLGYGVGFFDRIMFNISKGQLDSFGHLQKTWAVVLAAVEVFCAVLAAVLVWVLHSASIL